MPRAIKLGAGGVQGRVEGGVQGQVLGPYT